MLEPYRLQIFEQAFSAPLATVSAFAVTAKAARSVEQVRTIHPDDASFELCRNVKSHVDALAPDASGKAIHGIVGQFDRFRGSAEGHRRQHRAENLLLRHDRSGVNIAQQGGPEIK